MAIAAFISQKLLEIVKFGKVEFMINVLLKKD